jgi:O-antigen/teichoic acid export membrane protein
MPFKPKTPTESGAQQDADGTSPMRRNLPSRIVGYGMSRTVVEGLFAGRGLLLAGILGPELFGVWALFRICVRYISFAALGLLPGLEWEVSRSSRQSQFCPAKQTLWGRAAAGHTLLLYGVISVFTTMFWAWSGERLANMVLLGIAAGLLLDRYWNYGITFVRASGGLQRFAILELLHAALQFTACLSLALRWGLPGAFAGFAIANLAGIALLKRRAPLLPRFDPQRVYRLIRIGFPVSLMGILTVTLATVDRLLVGAVMGLGGLGVYAFAVSISELGVSFAAVVRTVILRDVYHDMESSRETEAKLFVPHRALSGYATFGPPLVGLFALVLPFLITLVAPDYDSAARAAQLLLFAGFVQGLSNLAVLEIVAGGRQGRLPILSIVAVCLNAILTLSALGIGLGLQGVAVAAFLTRLIHAPAILILLSPEASASDLAVAVVRFLAPSICCAVIVYLITQLLPADDMKTLMLQLVVYSAAAFAFFSAGVLQALAARRARSASNRP